MTPKTAPVESEAVPVVKKRTLKKARSVAEKTVTSAVKWDDKKLTPRTLSHGELRGMNRKAENHMRTLLFFLGAAVVCCSVTGAMAFAGFIGVVGGTGSIGFFLGSCSLLGGSIAALVGTVMRGRFTVDRYDMLTTEAWLAGEREREALQARAESFVKIDPYKHLRTPEIMTAPYVKPMPEPETIPEAEPKNQLQDFLKAMEAKETDRQALDAVISQAQRAELDELTGEEARAALRKLVALVKAQNG